VRHDSKKARNMIVERRLEDTPVPVFQLFDLAKDPGEATDVSARNPEIAERLKTRLAELIAAGRSRS
jgi:hypothetical protein